MTKQRLWTSLHTYEDIKYEFYNGIAKITINRPEVRNAFRPKTTAEMIDAFTRARDDERIGTIILTGEGEHAFRSSGVARRQSRVPFSFGMFRSWTPA